MEYSMIHVTPVEPCNIEASLNNLWEQNKGENRFRACLFNLIVYSSSENRSTYLSNLAEHIIAKFPSRVLLIKETEQHCDKILSSVANLKEQESSSSIFCDYIEFEVGKDAHKAIPFLVLPHLVANHPVYLLWDDDPLLKDPVSFALENTANRTIFDSNVTSNLAQFAQTLLDLQKQVSCSIADLNWARVTPFKTLLTNIFSTQTHFRILNSAQNLCIYYQNNSDHKGGYYRALYLQAFIASTMGYKYNNTLKSAHETHIHYSHKGKQVGVTLFEITEKKEISNSITKIELKSYENATLTIESMKQNAQVVQVQTTFTTHCQIPSHHIFDPELNNRTLYKEIYSKGTDPYFHKTIELLSKCEGL